MFTKIIIIVLSTIGMVSCLSKPDTSNQNTASTSNSSASMRTYKNASNTNIDSVSNGTTDIKIKTDSCFFTSDEYCYFLQNNDGGQDWVDTRLKCNLKDGEFPPKSDVEKYMHILGVLYNGMPDKNITPKISYIWTQETQTVYGWMQSISTEYNNSNWAKIYSGTSISSHNGFNTGDFNKKNNTGYACVRKATVEEIQKGAELRKQNGKIKNDIISQKIGEETKELQTIENDKKTIKQHEDDIYAKSNKKDTPSNVLEFNIDANFAGFGEIKVSVKSNLKYIDTSMDIYSIKAIYPEESVIGGIDYKKWYPTLLYTSDRNIDLNNIYNEEVGDVGEQKVDDRGSLSASFVLFSDKVAYSEYTDNDIKTLVASKTLRDNQLAMHAQAKNTFKKDKKVILEFKLFKSDLLGLGFNYDSIVLPKNCIKTELSEIICRKEVLYQGN